MDSERVGRVVNCHSLFVQTFLEMLKVESLAQIGYSVQRKTVAHNRYQLNSATQLISLQVGNANRRHIAKIRCRCANSIRVYRLLPLASNSHPRDVHLGVGIAPMMRAIFTDINCLI